MSETTFVVESTTSSEFARAVRHLQEPPAVLSSRDCRALLVEIERWRYLLAEASLFVWSNNREFSAQIDAALKESE